ANFDNARRIYLLWWSLAPRLRVLRNRTSFPSVIRNCSTSTLTLSTPPEAHVKLFTLPNGHWTANTKAPRDRGKAEFDQSSTIVAPDLRSMDFSRLQLPNAINFPFGRTPNPSQHPPTTVEQFKLIDSRFSIERGDTEVGTEV
ncbi:hypothetical protein FRC10_001766, partial [Ceratobasidium sp. 414]